MRTVTFFPRNFDCKQEFLWSKLQTMCQQQQKIPLVFCNHFFLASRTTQVIHQTDFCFFSNHNWLCHFKFLPLRTNGLKTQTQYLVEELIITLSVIFLEVFCWVLFMQILTCAQKRKHQEKLSVWFQNQGQQDQLFVSVWFKLSMNSQTKNQFKWAA